VSAVLIQPNVTAPSDSSLAIEGRATFREEVMKGKRKKIIVMTRSVTPLPVLLLTESSIMSPVLSFNAGIIVLLVCPRPFG
jgi:hypothetical protein